VKQLLDAGLTWVVDADLKSYFDSIPHDRLLELVSRRVADGRVLALVRRYLEQGIMDGSAEWTPEEGTPQGAVLSPLLANIYLDPLDHLTAASGFEMVRYADDFVILCRDGEAASAALALIRAWTESAGLTLHPEKTRLVDASLSGGFDFLGYHFERGGHWPSKKSVARLRERLRPETKRTNGHSLQCIVDTVNRIVRGWYAYYRHGNPYDREALDAWIRMRLRSILRRRSGRRGRSRNLDDHRRWPNASFAAIGLFSMAAAHAAECQSARR
jgi:RNA-directed DNA polymerase